MSWDDSGDEQRYRAVVNDEEQYSIWPEDRDLPRGWNDTGKQGTKAECLAYIEEVWTDMRPLSLRRQMASAAASPIEDAPPPTDAQPAEPTLVERLSSGRHPVEVSLRPEPTLAALQERLASGYVHVRFTATRGGTELGIRLEGPHMNLSGAKFASGEGVAHLVGTAILDDVPVRCIADIDLGTLAGEGHLEPLGAA